MFSHGSTRKTLVYCRALQLSVAQSGRVCPLSSSVKANRTDIYSSVAILPTLSSPLFSSIRSVDKGAHSDHASLARFHERQRGPSKTKNNTSPPARGRLAPVIQSVPIAPSVAIEIARKHSSNFPEQHYSVGCRKKGSSRRGLYVCFGVPTSTLHPA